MNNIIKSQIYKTIHNKIIWFALIATCMLNSMSLFDFLILEDVKLTGSFMAANGIAAGISALLFVLISSGIIIGSDFLDKTINYEVMAGHKKIEIFLGRYIVALVTGILGTFIIINLLPMIFTIANGWGNQIAVHDLLVRIAMIMLVIIRMVSIMAGISFILKNQFAAIAVLSIFGMVEFTGYMMQIFPDKLSAILVVPHVYDLLEMSSKITKQGQLVFEGRLATDTIVSTILINGLLSVIVIVFGLQYFKKTDME